MANLYTRRDFFRHALMATATTVPVMNMLAAPKKKMQVMTVTGMIDASAMRQTLIHEHVLVDFIGAEEINPPRWDREKVMEKALPYLTEVKNAGCQTFVDCTPNFLGRDVGLLKQLSEKTGMFFITNTGYYGGSNHKFLPSQVFTETADQLAARWVREWQDGIDGTPIKPGFIKISVNAGHLSDVSIKLINAAALTHLKTGLTICSHTGPATPAFEQIELLKSRRIDPSAFVWVHSQNEPDVTQHIKAARDGAWVSIDGLRENNIDQYVSILKVMKGEKCLHRVLISHDGGWYDPDEPDGGPFTPFTILFRKMIPALEQEGFSESEILQLIQDNPANAFAIGVRKLKRKKG